MMLEVMEQNVLLCSHMYPNSSDQVDMTDGIASFTSEVLTQDTGLLNYKMHREFQQRE